MMPTHVHVESIMMDVSPTNDGRVALGYIWTGCF
jgi:hypothetical protein